MLHREHNEAGKYKDRIPTVVYLREGGDGNENYDDFALNINSFLWIICPDLNLI